MKKIQSQYLWFEVFHFKLARQYMSADIKANYIIGYFES